MTESRRLLQHCLAALAYRTQKALREALADFAAFRAGTNVRTPHELLWHMTGVIGYARTAIPGKTVRPDAGTSVNVHEAERQRAQRRFAGPVVPSVMTDQNRYFSPSWDQ